MKQARQGRKETKNTDVFQIKRPYLHPTSVLQKKAFVMMQAESLQHEHTLQAWYMKVETSSKFKFILKNRINFWCVHAYLQKLDVDKHFSLLKLSIDF